MREMSPAELSNMLEHAIAAVCETARELLDDDDGAPLSPIELELERRVQLLETVKRYPALMLERYRRWAPNTADDPA